MKPTVVSCQSPHGVNAICYVGFCSPILDFACVYVQWASVCANGLNHIVPVDVKKVDSIIKSTFE